MLLIIFKEKMFEECVEKNNWHTNKIKKIMNLVKFDYVYKIYK